MNPKQKKVNNNKLDKRIFNNRILRAHTMREYADDAGKMTRGELEQAYIKCKFGKTRFFTIPQDFLDNIVEKECE